MLSTEDRIHDGHRSRMREKFSSLGARAFLTHELLEMLMFHVVPYRNTNPTAKNLLKEFKDINGLLSATPEETVSVKGVGARVSEMISALGEYSNILMNKEKTGSYSFSSDYSGIGEYLIDYFGKGRTDTCEVAFMLFNSRMELISCETLYGVDFAYAEIKAEKFVSRALNARASAAVIAHTHPFGSAYPTPGDLQTNNMISGALSRIGVELVEHYVISGKSYCGLMHHINTSFYQENFKDVLSEVTEDE